MKALSPDRAKRYGSVKELAGEVEAYQRGFATDAEHAGFFRQASLLVKRHRGIFTTAVLAWALITALAAWFVIDVTLERNRATEERNRATEERNRAETALTSLRGTAPTFYEQAKALIRLKNLDEAMEKVGYAISLAPKEARYHALRGNILQAKLEAREAQAAYFEAQRLDPSLPYLADNLIWCIKLQDVWSLPEIERQKLLREFQKVLADQQRADEAVVIGSLTADLQAMQFAWKQQVLEAYGPHAEVTFHGRGIGVILNQCPAAHDLTPLAGLPLKSLQCTDTGITDLSPLKGMSLESLNISHCRIRDLSPLEGMPLNWLSAIGTEVADLTPLKSARLTDLNISDTKIVDLSVLHGMPMEHLNFGRTRVQDLTPLAGAPLKVISFYNTSVRDIAPLKGAPLLELTTGPILSLEPLRGMKLTKLYFEGADDLSPIRGMPLEEIRIGNAPGLSDLSPLEGMSLHHIRLYKTPRVTDIRVLTGMPIIDARIEGCPARDLSPIHDAPLESFFLGTPSFSYEIGKEPDLAFLKGKKLTTLHLINLPSVDLDLLQSLPLRHLDLRSCNIMNLDFVKGMRLTQINLGKNPGITDLTPLMGSALTQLRLDGTGITSLEALRGLPLRELGLWDCAESMDVAPLAACTELTTLVLPPKAVNVAALRKLPHLRSLSYNIKNTASQGNVLVYPDESAAQFWKEFDGGK